MQTDAHHPGPGQAASRGSRDTMRADAKGVAPRPCRSNADPPRRNPATPSCSRPVAGNTEQGCRGTCTCRCKRTTAIGIARSDPGVSFNLETAVGRAQVGSHGVDWQGWMPRLQTRRHGFGRREEGRPPAGQHPARATTQLASASKEEQRGQRAPGRLDRVCSVITRQILAQPVEEVKMPGAAVPWRSMRLGALTDRSRAAVRH